MQLAVDKHNRETVTFPDCWYTPRRMMCISEFLEEASIPVLSSRSFVTSNDLVVIGPLCLEKSLQWIHARFELDLVSMTTSRPKDSTICTACKRTEMRVL